MIDKYKATLLALALAVHPAASAQEGRIWLPEVFRTSAAQAQEIPIGYASTASPQRTVVYSLGPLWYDNRWSPYVEAQFHVGVTKPCAGAVRLGYYIVRANSPQGTAGLYLSRYAVIDLPATPTDRPSHHAISQLAGHMAQPGELEIKNAHYNVVMFADSYDRACVGATLQIKGKQTHEHAGELTVANR
ncbi:hypothetical protein [Pseudomonas sp. CGJS7]|uniref:hypothetical protein n=1 Tax=Pseudomonas sp. CGJS7 TaxID=3109348 RepID=UPI00300B996E